MWAQLWYRQVAAGGLAEAAGKCRCTKPVASPAGAANQILYLCHLHRHICRQNLVPGRCRTRSRGGQRAERTAFQTAHAASTCRQHAASQPQHHRIAPRTSMPCRPAQLSPPVIATSSSMRTPMPLRGPKAASSGIYSPGSIVSTTPAAAGGAGAAGVGAQHH